MDNNNFRTFSEYMKKEDNANVQPPSATKMVQRLGELGLLKYEKYGVIILEEEGRKAGEALIRRHNTIEDLLKALGVSERAVLPETEKVEHTLSDETIKCFEEYVDFINKNPDVAIRFNAFRNSEE